MKRTKENRQWLGATHVDADAFLDAHTRRDPDAIISRQDMYDMFEVWCEAHERDIVGGMREFRTMLFVRLHMRGAQPVTTTDGNYERIAAGKAQLRGFRLVPVHAI